MSRGKRVKVGVGIYRDKYGLGAVVTVKGRQRELRFLPDTPLREIRDKMDDARRELRNARPTSAPRGTLAADADRYLPQIKHLASWREAWCEVQAWVTLLGHVRRDQITSEDVRVAMGRWTQEGYAPKTITNRINRLARLYRVLDGRKAPTPCDDVERLRPGKRPVVRVSDETLRAVAAAFVEREQKGLLRSRKTRARFLVLATTGRRPCEVMRAKPEDVNIEVRVWVPRDAKGGYSPGVYLNDDMVAENSRREGGTT